MSKERLFSRLAQYHQTVNLAACLSRMQDGVILDPHGKPYRAGVNDENEYYAGVLIVANGSTLVGKLTDARVITDRVYPTFHSVPTDDEFFAFHSSQGGKDRSYVYDSLTQSMARVRTFNNTPATLPSNYSLEGMLPRNEGLDDIGTKVEIAIILPQAYDNTDTYLIRRSPYGKLGMGAVMHFNAQGLRELLYLEHDPHSKGPFIDEDHKIVGIYKQFERRDGVVVPVVAPVASESRVAA